MAALWTVAWGFVGIVVGVLKWYRGTLIDVGKIPTVVAISLILKIAAALALYGAINGFLFASVLALAERKRSLASLSIGRFALWGVLASLVVPVLAIISLVIVFGVDSLRVDPAPLGYIAAFGSACATVILWIARRGRAAADETVPR
jgi:hypothetical protein